MFKKSVIEEKEWLFALAKCEELAEKKAKVYSRLLTETALAKEMEELAFRHEKRKDELFALAVGETPKKQNGQGMDEMNEKESEK